MKWILIRHGQTQGNRERRYIGCRTDEPLCPEGIAQWQNRHSPPVSRVFVSPMHRCVETANLLYPGVLQTIIGGFRECDFGEFSERKSRCFSVYSVTVKPQPTSTILPH